MFIKFTEPGDIEPKGTIYAVGEPPNFIEQFATHPLWGVSIECQGVTHSPVVFTPLSRDEWNNTIKRLMEP